MSKHEIFIINGFARSGKDTFVELFSKHYGPDKVWNYSSADKGVYEKVHEFRNSDAEILFLHIHDLEEIEKAQEEFYTETILIRRDWVPQITLNMADVNVFNYNYDITIYNNGTLEDYENIVKKFVKDVRMNMYFMNAEYNIDEV